MIRLFLPLRFLAVIFLGSFTRPAAGLVEALVDTMLVTRQGNSLPFYIMPLA